MMVVCRNNFFIRSLASGFSRKFLNLPVKRETVFGIEVYSTKVPGDGVQTTGSTTNTGSTTTVVSRPESSGLGIGEILSMNVDEKDVTRHESITDWWDPNGSMLGLHSMNDLRIALIRNGLENTGKLKGEDIKTNPEYLTGVKLIEVGCGGGILTEPLARLGADVTGVDPGQDLIEVARNHADSNAHNLKRAPTYVNTTIEEHSVNNVDVYDAVIASEVIEHVPNKQSFLEACITTVKPGGSIFLTTPNRTTASWLGAIILAENVFRIVPKGIHDWNQFITPIELKQCLDRLCCNTILINGMFYNPLINKWSWSSSTVLHYALHAVKKQKDSSKSSPEN